MKVCKSLCAAATLLAGAFGFAQSTSSQGGAGGLSMPAITAPSMPTVSVPTVGGGFYTPTAPTVNRNSAATDASQTASQSSQTATTTTTTNPLAVASQAQAANAIAGLTASDLTSMDSLGMLGSVSSLLGGNNLNALTATKGGSLSATTDSILLQQILNELTDMKKQLGNQNAAPTVSTEKTAAEQATAVSAQSFTQEAKQGPKILRFVVNGYNVLSTCRDIYFSTEETDGTFLLTGDRKYMSDGVNRSETFHLLFHSTGSQEGITNYAVTPAVTQDYTNTYSFLYQLAEHENLTAQRTGNLISMRVNDPSWKLDLLLSMDR